MGYNSAKMKMKKTLRLMLIAAFAVMVCLSSCKKAEKQIIGKWKITSCKENGQNVKKNVDETWTFKEGGKFSGTLGGDAYNAGPSVDCKWSISDNELTLNGGDLDDEDGSSITYILEIEELNKKVLVVSGKAKMEGGWDDDWDDDWKGNSSDRKVRYELEAK